MKKIFGFLLLVGMCMVGLPSCCGNSSSLPHKTSNYVSGNGENVTFKVIEIDSCEYLFLSRGYQGYFAHKGNCKYCEQRRKREQDKMVERIRELLKEEEQSIGKPIETKLFY